ncbi:MAG: DUF2797 domain-containing protein [Kangiellaceae bacterium]|nr:DUF2797 domain-containing protein [Kangiellaceae bacterium]
MRSELLDSSDIQLDRDDNLNYFLPLGEQELPLNQFIGKYLKLELVGDINCQHCGKRTNKSFAQGYCFPCMRKLAQCDMCIMKPETCHYHEGTCREPKWGENNCFVPHYVYLSNTSGLKVGITRHTQIPTRWIDQGATQGCIIYKVSTRQQSGLVEVAFKDLIADKTNWRTMLKENQPDRDLLQEAKELKEKIKSNLQGIISSFSSDEIIDISDGNPTEDIISIRYPVLEFPEKIKSHNFDKNSLVEGTLMGIKGQYLIFDTGVINIRKFTSYDVAVFDC